MIYLKADDEATFTAALKTAGWAWDDEYRVEVDSEGNETVTDELIRDAGVDEYTNTHSLDIIGVIHAETGNMIDGPADEQIAEMAPIDGWHANLLLHGEELPDALSSLVIEAPSAPVRRFA
jgi:hypothetical protein